MSILVQKYGGTSLADSDRIQNVARRIQSAFLAGNQVVVILSAMGKTTNKLLELASELSPNAPLRELDLLMSTGEQQSVAFMSIALQELGLKAISLNAYQVPMYANEIENSPQYGNARIRHIAVDKIRSYLEQGTICLVTGFQAIGEGQELYTLGRGGSDTSAVALAAALQTNKCEIYTDVDGIYTADPRKVTGTHLIESISYEEMLELARLGAGIMHSRSIELASKYDVELHIRSSFNEKLGTQIVKQEKIMEKPSVRGITLKNDEARISVVNVLDKPGFAAKLFSRLAKGEINVNLIVQNLGAGELNTISFTVLQTQLEKAHSIVEEFMKEEDAQILVQKEVAILSIVGIGMNSHSGIAFTMFDALAKCNVNIEMISTSEIKVSVVISAELSKEALQAVHDAFDL